MSTSAPDFTSLVNLASARLGASVVESTDDFFAPAERLIDDSEPVFKPGLYTEDGKWMDGWESRRRRTPGHDACIVRLAMPGRLAGVDVDTAHFVGNHPPHISLEAAYSPDGIRPDESDWVEVVGKSPADENAHNYYEISDDATYNYIRLNIFPDGGVARLRVYGEVVPDFPESDTEFELSSVRFGGRSISCSDEHFGRMLHLLLPDEPINMGDGWETRRRRGPGYDWVVVKLGCVGSLSGIEVHTTHFKGNYPDRCRIEGCLTEDVSEGAEWACLVDESKLEAHSVHQFDTLNDSGPFSHVRLSIFPDGGVARLRVFGKRLSK